VPSSTLGVGLNRDRCSAHAARRERRSASLNEDSRDRRWEEFWESSEPGKPEKGRKRFSDDLERLRRAGRELESERWEPRVTARSREGDPLMPGEEMDSFEAAARYVDTAGSPLPRWVDQYLDEEKVERIQRDLGSWRRRYS
jgi:hypothetical protein